MRALATLPPRGCAAPDAAADRVCACLYARVLLWRAVNLAVSLGAVALIAASAVVWDRRTPARLVRHMAGSVDGGEASEGRAALVADDAPAGVVLSACPTKDSRAGDGDSEPLLPA